VRRLAIVYDATEVMGHVSLEALRENKDPEVGIAVAKYK
jgi:hypothetical protein